MKTKKLLTILLTLFACVQIIAAPTQDEGVWYALRNFPGGDGYKFSEEKVLSLYGTPGKTVRFEASRQWGSTTGKVTVYQKINGNWGSVYTTSKLSTDWGKFYTCNIDPKATDIKFARNGGTLNRWVRAITVTMASYLEVDKTSISLPNTEIGKDLTASFTVEHSNINQLSVTSSNNTVWTPNVTTISESGPGKHGSKQITVTLSANKAREYKGKITISNGTQKAEVSLSCTVTKKAQTLKWAANTDVIPVGESVENAASATSTFPVSYTSDNEAVLKIENGKFIGVSTGTANVTASQAGDDTWAAATSITKAIEVTQKEVQTITWEQDLSRILLTDAPITLNANASSGLGVTYESSNPNVLSVSGHILTVVGKGEAVITAKQAGDNTWAPTSYSLDARVREIDLNAGALVLDQGEHNFSTISEKVFTLNGEPDELTFQAKCVPIKIVIDYWGGDLKVAQKVNGSWERVFSHTPPKNSYESYGPIKLKRNATQIKFYTETGATGKKYFRDIKVTLAKYMESSVNEVNFGDIQVGTNNTKTFDLKYSNLADIVEVKSCKNAFNLSGEKSFGNPGDKGSKSYGLSITPNAQGELIDTIVFTSTNQTTVRVPVVANVVRKTQAIEWKQEFKDVIATDVFDLDATASSKLAVSYTISDANIATINEANQLSFLKAGSVNIIATQEGNDEFAAAQSMTRTIVVAKATPTIIALPTYNSLVYGDALSAAVLTGGEASCEGTWAWENDTQILNAGSNSCVLKFTPSNTDIYNEYSETVTVEVAKAAQSITWEQELNLSVGDVLELTATGGDNITYSVVDADIATIEGSTLTVLTAGSTDITATLAGDENHESASITLTLSVDQKAQTITWEQDFSNANPESTFDLNATATSGLAVSYSVSDAEIAVINEANQLSFLKAGSVDITASQAGDNKFEAATDVMKTIAVAKEEQTITWEQDFDNANPESTFDLNATATSGLDVSYSVSDAEIAVINEANQLSFLKAGSVDITASQAGDNKFEAATDVMKTIAVAKEEQTITWEQDLNLSVGDEVELTATGGENITYTVENSAIAKVEGTTLTVLTAGSTNVTATLAGNDNYEVATKTLTLSVAKATQTIEWNQDFASANVKSTFDLNATTTSGLEVYFSVSDVEIAMIDGENKLSFFKTGTVDIIAIQEGNDDYVEAKSVVKTITVVKAARTITWEQDLNLYVGDVVELTASTENNFAEITYTLEDESFASIDGSNLTTFAAGETNLIATVAENDLYEAATCTLLLKVTDLTTDINDSKENIRIYPNPATYYIKVNSSFGDIINIYDMQGRIVLSVVGQESETVVDIQQLYGGNYILTSQSENGTTIVSSKFTKK